MLNIVYIKAKGEKNVWALDTIRGTRRLVTSGEWAAITTAHDAAGVKVAYSNEKISAARLELIPIG